MSKTAVIYGTDRYYNVSGGDLQGCINDAIKWKAYAEARGYNVVYMTNPSDGVFKAAANAAIANAYSGDVILIAGSSHGSYMNDTSGDESDHRDELICFSNFSASGGYLTDDQFRTMLAALKEGVICDVFLDNCFSGTATRLGLHKIPVLGRRYLPFPGAKKIATKAAPKAIITTMKESLFAACAPNQTSTEVLIGGLPRGLASYYWLKCLTMYPAYTRDQVTNWVRTKVAAVVSSQTPQLECRAVNASRVPFT